VLTEVVSVASLRTRLIRAYRGVLGYTDRGTPTGRVREQLSFEFGAGGCRESCTKFEKGSVERQSVARRESGEYYGRMNLTEIVEGGRGPRLCEDRGPIGLGLIKPSKGEDAQTFIGIRPFPDRAFAGRRAVGNCGVTLGRYSTHSS